MKVITRNKILVNPDMNYSRLDGKSPTAEILAMQKLINSKGEKLVDETGVFDAKTSEVYNKYKTRLDREFLEMGYEPIKLQTKPLNVIENPITPAQIVPTFFKADFKTSNEKTSWWSKRTKTQKGLIIGGAVAVTGLTVWLIVRSVKRSTATTIKTA